MKEKVRSGKKSKCLEAGCDLLLQPCVSIMSHRVDEDDDDDDEKDRKESTNPVICVIPNK